MLYRKDNPELFAVIEFEYKRICDDKLPPILSEFTDEQLAQIKSLTIKASSLGGEVKSLAGIEKLTNLEHLSIRGQDVRQYMAEFEESIKKSQVIAGYNLENDMKFFENEYNSGQINDSDLEYLYQLYNLKTLDLSNQRALTKFDFSNFWDLEKANMHGCTSLKTIKGLENLNVFTDEQNDRRFGAEFLFDACYNLKNVENFDTLLEEIKAHPIAVSGHKAVVLPTTTYLHLVRNNPRLENDLNEWECEMGSFASIAWVESCSGEAWAESKSNQMSRAKQRVDQIIRTVCEGEAQSDLATVGKLYRWICDNIRYDYEGLEKETKEFLEQRQWDKDKLDRYNQTIRGHRTKDKLRSSYRALFDKKAVCAGVSNLFNFFVEELGFCTESCECSSEADRDSTMTISNHAISVLDINGYRYYCDPTWDLGRTESQYFCLTKNELLRDHQLTVADNAVQSGMSLQGILRDNALVTSPTQQAAPAPQADGVYRE